MVYHLYKVQHLYIRPPPSHPHSYLGPSRLLEFSAMINILEYDIIVCNIKFRQCFWATFVPSETNATDRELSVDGPSRSKWHQFIFRPFSKLCLYTFPFRVVCILTLFMELMNAYLCTMV